MTTTIRAAALAAYQAAHDNSSDTYHVAHIAARDAYKAAADTYTAAYRAAIDAYDAAAAYRAKDAYIAARDAVDAALIAARDADDTRTTDAYKAYLGTRGLISTFSGDADKKLEDLRHQEDGIAMYGRD
jgi:hypothetical protein